MTNSEFLIPIYFPSDGVNLGNSEFPMPIYFPSDGVNLGKRFFHIKEFIV